MSRYCFNRTIKELTKVGLSMGRYSPLLPFPLTMMIVGIGALSILVAVSIIPADYALRKDRSLKRFGRRRTL